jgi:hypothetical protein
MPRQAWKIRQKYDYLCYGKKTIMFNEIQLQSTSGNLSSNKERKLKIIYKIKRKRYDSILQYCGDNIILIF